MRAGVVYLLLILALIVLVLASALKNNQRCESLFRSDYTGIDAAQKIPRSFTLVKAITYRENIPPNLGGTTTEISAFGRKQAERQSFNPSPIPKRIIQTNERSMIPSGMAKATQTLLDNNPDYEYLYFTDFSARDFLVNNYSDKIVKAYDKLIPGAYKADLFRYCVLERLGGIYIDTGMIASDGCISLDETLGTLGSLAHPGALHSGALHSGAFVCPEDNFTGGAYNAFIACTPNHEIIRTAIKLAVDNIERETYTNSPLGITGPILLAKAFKDVVGEPVLPNKNYGRGIRTLSFRKEGACETGMIYDNDRLVLLTRYPFYRLDQIQYNTKPHYSELWKFRNVFALTKKV